MRVFEDAKQHAYRYWADHRRSYLAWFGAEQEEERALLGPDPWPYSIEQNRVALETLLDYAVEQGLTERRLAIREIFAPEHARLTATAAVRSKGSIRSRRSNRFQRSGAV